MLFRRLCFLTLGVILKTIAFPFWLASVALGLLGKIVSRRGYEIGYGAMSRFIYRMTRKPQKEPGVLAVRGVGSDDLKIFSVRPY